MESIFEIYKKLKTNSSSEIDGFNVASIPTVKNHKIGISQKGLPIFFIKCYESNQGNAIDTNLEFISVQYNKECQLLSNSKKTEDGIYTVISLNTDSLDLQEYFLEIVSIVIKKLPDEPELKELRFEVEKLINLFSKLSQPPLKTIQGLWGELLVIELSKSPIYFVQAWHKSKMDKFDFNDGKDKIEVKSTSKNRRVHTFSLEQLNPNLNSNLIIASLFANETGVGKSVFDLVKMIEKKTKNDDLIIRINEIIADTLGSSFERAFDTYFDYQLAIDTLKYYTSESIPSIDIKCIPKEVSNVHFESDLTDIVAVNEIRSDSVLHKALF